MSTKYRQQAEQYVNDYRALSGSDDKESLIISLLECMADEDLMVIEELLRLATEPRCCVVLHFDKLGQDGRIETVGPFDNEQAAEAWCNAFLDNLEQDDRPRCIIDTPSTPESLGLGE